MDNISSIKENCVGCRACEQSCPINCISIESDEEGFIYPIIKEKECIHCGKCLEVCPTRKNEFHRHKPIKVYGLRNNSIDIMNSASGGAADIAAKIVLRDGGIVYGAAYDEEFKVKHIRIKDDFERNKLQSSKYVQSNLYNCYSKAKVDICKGRLVLFTGTPCQIAGLYSFLGEDKDNLLTIDLICHGVPSPLFLSKYLKYQSTKLNGEITYFNFRSKEKRGWNTQLLLKTKTKTKTQPLTLDKYGKHFMESDCYRECCYKCMYANTNRVADITIGDFWGISKSHPEFYSKKGVSSVFINTLKGEKLFKSMKAMAQIQEATLEEGLEKQGNLIRPSIRPQSRDEFYKGIKNYNYIEKISVGPQIKERIKLLLPQKLKEMIKKL